HSYYVKTNDQDVLLATSPYDVEVPAVVGKENVFGTQFHPEKSSAIGMHMLQNYANFVEKRSPSYEQI
ncbi:glutamine amidotransferase-related protein, partial [Priestia megaterium]|uniref:glutamine amidotransferase-related protein n=2 Tax=Bacillaceae TaxID=186817 RepID=UPI0030578997